MYDFLINVTRQQNEKIEPYKQNVEENQKEKDHFEKIVGKIKKTSNEIQGYVAKSSPKLTPLCLRAVNCV